MSLPKLQPGTYGFDDLQVGDWYQTGEAEITVAHIDAFAELSGDRFEIHMDETAARNHGFEARVAHGLLVLSITDGLKNLSEVRLRAQASLGWDWSFKAPVLAGDRIQARLDIVEKKPISDPTRGILKLKLDVRNQNGLLVQSGLNNLMTYR